jgi:hypothetical protein
MISLQLYCLSASAHYSTRSSLLLLGAAVCVGFRHAYYSRIIILVPTVCQLPFPSLIVYCDYSYLPRLQQLVPSALVSRGSCWCGATDVFCVLFFKSSRRYFHWLSNILVRNLLPHSASMRMSHALQPEPSC